jgi:hypothetical protein
MVADLLNLGQYLGVSLWCCCLIFSFIRRFCLRGILFGGCIDRFLIGRLRDRFGVVLRGLRGL